MIYPTDFINKIVNIDCLIGMKDIPDNSVDMIFTSPPYNTGGKGKCKGFYQDYDDNLTDGEYYNLLSGCLKEGLRICNGGIFININYTTNNKRPLYRFISDFSEFLKENIIWKKENVQPPIGNILGKRYEYILLFTKNKDFEINDFRNNKGEKYKHIFGNWVSNLIELKKDGTKFSDIHKAGFSIDLPSLFIEIYTKENDIVLDPFIGLGTTAVAAKHLDRRFIGMEISEDYCEVSRQRLGQKVLI